MLCLSTNATPPTGLVLRRRFRAEKRRSRKPALASPVRAANGRSPTYLPRSTAMRPVCERDQSNQLGPSSHFAAQCAHFNSADAQLCAFEFEPEIECLAEVIHPRRLSRYKVIGVAVKGRPVQSIVGSRISRGDLVDSVADCAAYIKASRSGSRPYPGPDVRLIKSPDRGLRHHQHLSSSDGIQLSLRHRHYHDSAPFQQRQESITVILKQEESGKYGVLVLVEHGSDPPGAQHSNLFPGRFNGSVLVTGVLESPAERIWIGRHNTGKGIALHPTRRRPRVPGTPNRRSGAFAVATPKD